MSNIHRFGFHSSFLVLAALASFATGCGGSIQGAEPAPTGGDAGVAQTDPATTPAAGRATPPSRPATASSEAPRADRWLVVKTVRLGVSNAAGQPDPNAWKTVGFDLDGLETTADDSRANVGTACDRPAGAYATALLDGNGGIDNNFGSQVMTVLKTVDDTIESDANASIAAGTETMLLHLEGVGPQNDPHVAGDLYIARSFSQFSKSGAAPRFDGTDEWPVLSSSLVDGETIGAPVLRFADGYVAGGVWVSGDATQPTRFALDVSIGVTLGDKNTAAPVALPLSFVQVAVGIDGSNGTIAGAIAVSDVASAVAPGLDALGICAGSSTYESVVTTFSAAADLSLRGANFRSPGAPCDAISIGFGFDAVTAMAPTQVVKAEPLSVKACAGT